MTRFALLAVVAAGLLGSGCATVLRGSSREVTVYGPQDLQVLQNGSPVALTRVAEEGPGRVRYTALVDRKQKELVVRAGGTETPARLGTQVSTGWLVLDIVLGPYIFPWAVDWGTGAWNNFSPVDAGGYLAAARSSPRGPSYASSAGARPAASSASQRAAIVDHGRLAVLDFRNFAADLKPEDVRYFADVVRGATLKSSPALEVITRENLLVLLDSTGKDAANCEGECEVDTGRRIGADAVISGEILKVGTRYKMSLKLHETRDGRLLSTSVASGRSIDELDESAQLAASELIQPVR